MKKSVLIVDDEPNIRESLAKVLRRAGYETSIAADGAEAEAINRQHGHDLVLLDLNMPVKNGWDTFESISTLDPLTPVIVITGRPGQFVTAAAARVGALMEKPLDMPRLLQTIERLIAEPASVRLSRLTFGTERTEFFGASDPWREVAPDPTKLAALLRLRKAQLDDLRSNGAPSQSNPNQGGAGEGFVAPVPGQPTALHQSS